MSYWIIHSVPGRGLFFTADTRTVADFQDGEGTFYCDGATKLFYFHNTDNSRKGGICIAGTGIHQTTDQVKIAIQTVVSGVISSDFFANYLDNVPHINAKSIYDYILKYVRKVTAKHKFALENGTPVNLATIIEQQCAISIGFINGEGVNSVFATGFLWDGKFCAHSWEDCNILLGSNDLYSVQQIPQTTSESQVLHAHKSLISKFKEKHAEMKPVISDSYDQLYYPKEGNAQGAFTDKVGDICSKSNYTKFDSQHEDLPSMHL